eukprot:811844-Prymnesium_polylepis.1
MLGPLPRQRGVPPAAFCAASAGPNPRSVGERAALRAPHGSLQLRPLTWVPRSAYSTGGRAPRMISAPPLTQSEIGRTHTSHCSLLALRCMNTSASAS